MELQPFPLLHTMLCMLGHPVSFLAMRSGIQASSRGSNSSQGFLRKRHWGGVECMAASGLGHPGTGGCHGRKWSACPQRHLTAPRWAVGCGCLPPWVSPLSCCNKQMSMARLINFPSQDAIKHKGQPISNAISNTNSVSGVLRMPSPCYQLCRVPCIAQKLSNVGCGCRVESLFFGGMKGEVWIQPGKLPSQVSTFWKHTTVAIAVSFVSSQQTVLLLPAACTRCQSVLGSTSVPVMI